MNETRFILRRNLVMYRLAPRSYKLQKRRTRNRRRKALVVRKQITSQVATPVYLCAMAPRVRYSGGTQHARDMPEN